jgi:glucose-6-phosphate 1-dehydrogenase
MIRQLIIFGASGDLRSRYLIPACAEIYAGGYLPDGFRILGVDREDLASPQALNRFLHRTVPEHAVFHIDHLRDKQTV